MRVMVGWRQAVWATTLTTLLGVGCSANEPQDACHDHIGSHSQAVSCGGQPPAKSFSAPIDALASYDAQSQCDPTAKPGVIAFRDLVLATYPCTGDFGIERACNVGGTSEHKEGRAWDWKVAVGNQAADDLLDWLLAPDAQGNKYAMLRRMGVMYMVWNKKIWGAYRPQDGWRAYSGDPHTDHVHFSFSWAGANKTTSYWAGQTLPPDSGPPPTPDSGPPPTPDSAVAPPDLATPTLDQAIAEDHGFSSGLDLTSSPRRDLGGVVNNNRLLTGGCQLGRNSGGTGAGLALPLLALLGLLSLRRCAESRSRRR
jgi:hypothetical protein